MQAWFLLPPTADREHADGITIRQSGRTPLPNVGVDRAAIPDGTQHPIVAARRSPDLASFFCLRCLVDPLPELRKVLEGALHGEAQRMGGIAMPSRPAALTRIRLDIVGQRDPQFHVLVSEREQLVARPGQTM